MSIEFYSHNDLCDIVKEEFSNFKHFFQKETQRTLKDAKIFFINEPRINNLQKTDIDLLLIIATEVKKGNYYIVKNIEHNGKKATCYLKNIIIPIKFITNLQNHNIEILPFSLGRVDIHNFLIILNDEN